MRVLDRIRNLTHRTRTTDDATATHECIHGTLVAHWADAKDLGDESKATEYVCSSCSTHFSPEAAAEVRRLAVERLRL